MNPIGLIGLGLMGEPYGPEPVGGRHATSGLPRSAGPDIYPALQSANRRQCTLLHPTNPAAGRARRRSVAKRLQKANTSPRPILLITRRGEGHGVTSSFSQRVGNTGAELSFFAEELGLAPAAPPTSPSNETPD